MFLAQKVFFILKELLKTKLFFQVAVVSSVNVNLETYYHVNELICSEVLVEELLNNYPS
jgi:hypothetical protein